MKSVLFSLLMVAVFMMNACSSNPAKKDGLQLTKADSLAIADAVAKQLNAAENTPAAEARLPENIDAAHESFIRALEMEMRGERALANVFWLHAAESDPYNRFLTFKMAEMLMAEGQDSLALVQAARGKGLKGKILASQLSLLAHLYVKAGIADSSRKYFKAALDSSKYQDMSLLYDYSLFLEAVRDNGEELVRIYDLLLPQVNFMPSLMQRQLNLLLDLKKDSAVVDLFGRAHEATGEKEYLAKMVQGLVFQKRLAEARTIVDTLSTSTEDDETMVVVVMTALADVDRAEAYKLIKKKYYEDGVRTPLLANFLGHYENLNGERDSAKVHLKFAAENLVEQKVYVVNAYHALAGIAVKENRLKEAVLYAEKADSVSMGGEKAMLAMMYASAKMYDKAYAMLDSLIAVWDKWSPLAGVADSVTLEKMNREVARNKRQFRSVYARILVSEAQEMLLPDRFDSVKIKAANVKRGKAQLLYENLAAEDSTDLDLRMMMAMNLERMGRYDESFRLFETMLDSALADRVDRPEVLNYYGYTLIDLNRSAEEVEKGYGMVLQALATEKTKTATEAYLDSKAWGLFRKGKFDEALKVMQEIKNPKFDEDPVYWEHMAAIQEALGLKAEATASYKKLQKLSPKHPEANRFLKGRKK